MRSTRIRLAAIAALAALASPRPTKEKMMRKALFFLVTVALLSIVAGCSGGGDAAKNDSAPSSPTTVPAEGATVEPSEDVRARGWIAFRSGSEIVAVDPANPKDTLVLGPSLGADPIAWSADGSKLLLRSRQDGVPLPGLFVLHPDGSRTTLVRENPLTGSGNKLDEPVFPYSHVTWGAFSPDGTEVAFASDGSSRGPYIIDAEGGKPRPLGRCQNPVHVQGVRREFCGEPLEEAAAWSPDGSQIAWSDFVEDSATYGHHARVLSFVNPDGTGLHEEVAPLPGTGLSLVWSPDGSQLAFWETEDLDRPGQIFVINADGSGLRQVTRDGDNRWPAWSPDGSRIAFVHNGTLSTIAPNGTDMQSMNGVIPDGAIAWNPAG